MKHSDRMTDMTPMRHPFPYELTFTAGSLLARLLANQYHTADTPEAKRQKLEAQRDRTTDSIASEYHVKPEELLLGSSTTALIDLVLQHIYQASETRRDQKQKPTVLLPIPTYSNVYDFLQQNNWDVKTSLYPSTELYDKSFLESFIKTIKQDRPTVVFIPNPNNPTGASFTVSDMQEIAKTCADVDAWLIVDEAYSRAADFHALTSAVHVFTKVKDAYKKLILIESFQKNKPLDKEGKIKLGTLVGHVDLISQLKDKILAAGSSIEPEIAPLVLAFFNLNQGVLQHWVSASTLLNTQIDDVWKQLRYLSGNAHFFVSEKRTRNGVFVVERPVRMPGGKTLETKNSLVDLFSGQNVKVTPIDTSHASWTGVDQNRQVHTPDAVRVVVQDRISNQKFIQALRNIFSGS